LIRKLIFLSAILATTLSSCSWKQNSAKSSNIINISFDLDSIKKRGRLIAVTDFNSTNYFIYKGEPMGFHYELLRSFSDHLGIDLEILAENNPDNAYSLLISGKADLLAVGLNADSSGRDGIQRTKPIAETRQVLVQRKPASWRTLSRDDYERSLIRNISSLAKQKVYVQKGSSRAGQLHSLENEINDTITVIEVPYESEKLIQNVASGKIDYTVCDENVAVVNATYYPGIDIGTPVSLPDSISWGLRSSNSDSLSRELNRWISAYRKTESYAVLYAKYFKNTRSSKMVRSDYYALNTGKVSKYDDMIRHFSAVIEWDWRLLASLIFQESGFKPDVRSWAGAYGLMQIMPVTGRNFGIDITSSPENNMKAGIQYINWLYSIFGPKISDENELINFILAAYNAGSGHILDAMKLTEKNGMDPEKWDGNVALWVLKISDPRYYNDTVVKNGYFKGRESVAFVSQVLNRYEHYKNIIPEEKPK
jgi:membrane-bound lytic murein transglycosylase F